MATGDVMNRREIIDLLVVLSRIDGALMQIKGIEQCVYDDLTVAVEKFISMLDKR